MKCCIGAQNWGSCDDGTELSGSLKGGEFLD